MESNTTSILMCKDFQVLKDCKQIFMVCVEETDVTMIPWAEVPTASFGDISY